MDNQISFKKRYSVPLVVLLISMASLVGVAYAYQSSVYEIGDNPVTTDYYVLDYTNSSKVSITTPIASDTVDFDIFTETVNGSTTMYSDGSEFTREFYLTVKTDMDCQFKIHIDCTGDTVLGKLFTINTIADKTVDGNTAVKITATFTPLSKVDLSTVGLTTDTTDMSKVADVQQEIETHVLTFHMTATPVE